jgi:hypothetical protein
MINLKVHINVQRKTMFISSFVVPDPDPHGSALISVQKMEKNEEISCSLIKAEGFSCSLGVIQRSTKM